MIAASGFLGYGMIDAWQEHRSRGQLPSRPGQDSQGLESAGGQAATAVIGAAPGLIATSLSSIGVSANRGQADGMHPG